MPSQLELACMKVLWQMGSATVAEVRAQLPRPLAYTTVMTVLDRMAAKGLVARRKHGRAYKYSAALDLDCARLDALHQLLHNFFADDRQALVQYLSRATPTPPPVQKTRAAVAVAGARTAAARTTRRAVPDEPSFRPSEIDDSLL
jgi:predicted transcriptional regulator